jgi:hypothetical protein
MAYAKSKSSYPAWVHAFIPTLVKAAKSGAHEDVELPFPTPERAKKARFELYGFINCLLDSKLASDKEDGQWAKSWSIAIRENEATGQWYLRFSQRNTIDETNAIFSVIAAMEEKITQAGGKVIPEAPRPPSRPRIPTLAEKLAATPGDTLLSTEDIYGTAD